MRRLRIAGLVSVVLFAGLYVARLTCAASENDTESIRAVMDKSALDWNRGDLDAFATSYKNSPDILFIGRKVRRGYAQMLDGYRKAYSSREKMGTLSFADLEVQPLDAHFATATGRFHLQRTAAGGGDADGHFMLVLEKTEGGWKIVRDDTTNEP